MINVNVNVERISNGIIVQCLAGADHKRFYPSLEAFLLAEVMEEIKQTDKDSEGVGGNGESFSLFLVTRGAQE